MVVADNSAPVLAVNISLGYRNKPKVLSSVSFEVRERETVGLIGTSGSGKSSLALAILQLLGMRGGQAEGSVRLRGRELLECSEREMRQIRGKEIGFVQQSPISALNPVLRLGSQFQETWAVHARGSATERDEAIIAALKSVSLPCDKEFLDRRASQLSVGQAQRALIALASIHHPSLLIADEPTSALDMITQAEILKLFAELTRSQGMGLLYISHDLLSVASICDRIVILHDGAVVESGPTREVFNAPKHPFTAALIAAIPSVELRQLSLANDSQRGK
jgi:peptide/nickel transport system ATP-binding protein